MVADLFVEFAPQRGERRHRQRHGSTVADQLAGSSERYGVVGEVLDDVERTDQVGDARPERQPTNVADDEGDPPRLWFPTGQELGVDADDVSRPGLGRAGRPSRHGHTRGR